MQMTRWAPGASSIFRPSCVSGHLKHEARQARGRLLHISIPQNIHLSGYRSCQNLTFAVNPSRARRTFAQEVLDASADPFLPHKGRTRHLLRRISICLVHDESLKTNLLIFIRIRTVFTQHISATANFCVIISSCLGNFTMQQLR